MQFLEQKVLLHINARILKNRLEKVLGITSMMRQRERRLLAGPEGWTNRQTSKWWAFLQHTGYKPWRSGLRLALSYPPARCFCVVKSAQLYIAGLSHSRVKLVKWPKKSTSFTSQQWLSTVWYDLVLPRNLSLASNSTAHSTLTLLNCCLERSPHSLVVNWVVLHSDETPLPLLCKGSLLAQQAPALLQYPRLPSLEEC